VRAVLAHRYFQRDSSLTIEAKKIYTGDKK